MGGQVRVIVASSAVYAVKRVAASAGSVPASAVLGAVAVEPIAIGGGCIGLVGLVLKILNDGKREAEIRQTYQQLITDLRSELRLERDARVAAETRLRSHLFPELEPEPEETNP